MNRRARRPVESVLFLQSSVGFFADAQVHASLARLLPSHGFAVYAACNPGSADEPSPCLDEFSAIPGITVRRSSFGPTVHERTRLAGAVSLVVAVPSILASIVGLSRYVRRHRIGVVHCSEKMREAVIAYAVARLSGARLVVHLHVKPADWFSAPTRWVMHRADRLVAISQFVADAAVAMGYDSERVAVALNGLTFSPDDLQPRADDRQWLTSEFGVAAESNVICCAARINRFKGHRDLLEALATVHHRGVEFTFVAAGRNDASETSPAFSIEALRRFAESLGIGDHVIFTGFRNDVTRLIRSCDIFAMASGEEPFGLVYIEAMAAGKPVVALSTGGTPEVVIDGETGLLSAYGDKDALVDNLEALLRDRSLRSRLGVAGQQRVASRFSADRAAEDMLAIYRSL